MNWQLELTPQHRDTLRVGLGVRAKLWGFLRPVPLVPGQTLIFGRSRECDVCVPSPDVSRRHTRVWFDEEGVWLLDLETMNGTRYQGHRQPELARVRGPTRLEVDDLFHVGEFVHVLTARFPVPEQWLTWSEWTIPSLARTIQTNRDWEALPVLADALEDANCDNVELLRHFRELPHKLTYCAVLKHLLDSFSAAAALSRGGLCSPRIP